MLILVDAQHNRLDFLIFFENLGWFSVFLRPGKFSHMHQTLYARFQFHESPIRDEIDDLALDLGSNGIFALDKLPRVLGLLF